MHPPEAYRPAKRSDAAKYQCHSFETLHVEKLGHNERLKIRWALA